MVASEKNPEFGFNFDSDFNFKINEKVKKANRILALIAKHLNTWTKKCLGSMPRSSGLPHGVLNLGSVSV